MNNNGTKAAIGIIIVVVIAAGIWWYMSSHQAPVAAPETASTGAQTQPVQEQAPQGILTTQANDSSDAALQSDMSSVDNESKGLDSDSANIDQSMSATQ